MKTIRFLIPLLVLLLVVSPTEANPTVLDSLTLEQRVAQMFMVTIHGSQLNEPGREFLRTWQPGAVSLFDDNAGTPEAVTQLTNTFQQTITEAGGLPMLIAIDQEGGVVMRLQDEGFTRLPAAMLIGANGDPAMPTTYGAMIGAELAAVGINMNLAPVADLETNPDNPIITRRSMGNGPQIVGEVVSGVVRGIQSQQVAATVKHFPGHGDTAEDSHAVMPVVNHDRERLQSVEFVPFQMAVDAGVDVVMMSHIWYPAIEPERLPASLSANMIQGVLRNEMGFNGVVMTDAMDMDAIDQNFPPMDAVVMAINAGVDMIALGPSYGWEGQVNAMQSVINAVNDGRIPEERINDAVTRILELKTRNGVLDWTPLDVSTARQRVNIEAHAEVIQNVFNTSVTVAYDNQGAIPFAPERRVAILFLGTRYQIYNECSLHNHPNITWMAISDAPSAAEISQAQRTADLVDTIVVFTQNAVDTVEQQELVNALPPEKTIAVALWSPYDWTTYPNIAGYVAVYTPMRPAVPAICDVLFGVRPAVGRFPLTLGDTLVAGSRAGG